MKRSPLPKRRTPLSRSTKPLKRTALKRGKGGRAKAIDVQLKAAKDWYFNNFGKSKGAWAYCQYCEIAMRPDDCAAHHKLKRSLGGKHGKKNLVIIHHDCHGVIHEHPELLKKVLESNANAEDGGFI